MIPRRTVLTLIVFFLLSSMLPILKVSAATVQIAVDPVVSNVTIGDTFQINITVTNINHFTCWQLVLYYRNAILNASAVTEGPFLKSAGGLGTYFFKNITNNFNSTHGQITTYCSLLGPEEVNGNGTIVTVTLKAIGGGSTLLHMNEIKLGDEKIPPQPIPFTEVDGTVNVAGGAGNHDVAATNATSYRRVVGRGFINNITVTLENQGDFAETFNLTIRANATDIGTKEVTLSYGNSVQIIFQWNSSGFPYANYTLSAYAWPVQNETDIDDNTFVGGRSAVLIPGDIKTDGVVNILDSIVLGIAFNSHSGDPNWNPDADINGDGVPNILDAIIIGLHFLEQQ